MKPTGTNRHPLNPSDPGGTRYIVTSPHVSAGVGSSPTAGTAFQMMPQGLGYHAISGHNVISPGHLGLSLLNSSTHQQLLQQMHMAEHMPSRRAPNAMRLSLLRDIGKAGERDRAETSMSSQHSFMQNPYTVSHDRPTMGISNLSTHNILNEAAAMQSGSLTPPHHMSLNQQRQFSNQSPRISMPAHFPMQPTTYMSANKSVKTEPGVTYIKDEALPTMMMSQPANQQQASYQASKAEPSEKKSNINHVKEELVQTMEKFDRDILKVTNEIDRLERKKQQLEEAAKKPREPEKESIPPKKAISKHQELWQVIYAENKKKAEAAKDVMRGLGRWYEMPLYNQPCDTDVYKENIKKNEEMRPKLLAYFKKRATLNHIRDSYLSTRYDELMDEWQKKIAKQENNPKRKAKDAKVRDFFEKQFPEIKKQREQQDRFQRGNRGDSCRSDADLAEIVDGLTEQENHEQNMRQLAVVPPILLDKDERRIRFINNNGLIKDAFKDYKEQQQLDNWSEAEKEIFKEKYISHPKNFNLIASCLEKKSVQDCVLFYYLMKKKINYKSLSRKNSMKPRKPKSRGQQSNQNELAKPGEKNDKDEKKEGDVTMKDETEERIDRPPSPRVTRSRNRNLNWTDEDIVVAKEGFMKHGKDYGAISRLFSNKTVDQVKNFYNNYKKKLSLDQLINSPNDTKKKKETRRGRSSALAEPVAENESTITEDESSKDSNDAAVSSKKSRKDNNESPLTVQENVVMTTENMESSDTPPVTTSQQSNTLTIRTRRAVAVSENKENSKRPPDTQTLDAPAEKRQKKSRTNTPTKKDEKTTEEKKEKEAAKSSKAAKSLESKLEKASTSTTVTSTGEPSASVTTTSKQSVEAQKASGDAIKEVASSTKPNKPATAKEQKKEEKEKANKIETPPTDKKAETPKASKPPVTTTTTVTKPQEKPKSVVEQKPDAVAVSKPDVVLPVTSVTGVVPQLPLPTTESKRVEDDDSSATCSADEDSATMTDFGDEAKATHKQSESPYAFDDNSTSSIRLEKSKPTTKTLTYSQARPIPAQTFPVQPGASRTIAQATWVPPKEDKRPQSVPSEPPPTKPPTMQQPKASPKLQVSRPSSTPMYAVQEMRVPENLTRNSSVVSMKIPVTTMSITIPAQPTQSAGISTTKDQQPVPITMPQYHTVPKQAASMQKDFDPMQNVPRELTEPRPSGPRTYTVTEKAAMRDRAAVIPVNQLKYPSSDKEAFRRPEHMVPISVQAHMIPQSIHLLGINPSDARGIGVSMLQGKPLTTMSKITTSAIPTKFVTTLIPGTKKVDDKIIQEAVPMNLSRSTSAVKHPVPPHGVMITSEHYQRASAPPEAMKYIQQSRGSIVQGTPVGDRKLITSPAKSHPQDMSHGAYKTTIIAGKEVRVHQPTTTPERRTSGERVMGDDKIHGVQYVDTFSSNKDASLPKHKASILQGTPIPRKHSDDSGSGSPRRSPAMYPGHPPQKSPTVQQQLYKDRHTNPSPIQLDMTAMSKVRTLSSPFSHQIDKSKVEAQQQSQAWSEANRPPSSDLRRELPSSHNVIRSIKQEAPSPRPNPMYTGSPLQTAVSLPSYIPPDLLRMQLQHQQAQDILRQYNIATAVGAGSLHGSPAHLYAAQRLPFAAPGAGHIRAEITPTTLNMNTVLSQDFQTARLMDKSAHTAASISTASSISAALNAAAASIPAAALQGAMPRLPAGVPAHLLTGLNIGLLQQPNLQNIQNLGRAMQFPSFLPGAQVQIPGSSPHRASQSPNPFLSRSPDTLQRQSISTEDLTNWKNSLGRSPGSSSSSPRIDANQEKYLSQRHGSASHSPSPHQFQQSPHREYARTPPSKKSEQAIQREMVEQQMYQRAIQQKKQQQEQQTQRVGHHVRTGSYDQRIHSPNRGLEQRRTGSPSLAPQKHAHPIDLEAEISNKSKKSGSYGNISQLGRDRKQPTQQPVNISAPSPKQQKMTSQSFQDDRKKRNTPEKISQQSEELMKKGSTKMTAENLIDAIIYHQMDKSNEDSEEGNPAEGNEGDKSGNASGEKPVSAVPRVPVHPMYLLGGYPARPPQSRETLKQPVLTTAASDIDKSHSTVMEPSMQNWKQQSQKIINEIYSPAQQHSRPASRSGATAKDKSPSYKTEPISPPSSKKRGSGQAVNLAFDPMIAQTLRNQTHLGSSLEDIIRAALKEQSPAVVPQARTPPQESDHKARSTPVSVISSGPPSTESAAKKDLSQAQQHPSYLMSALAFKKDPNIVANTPPPQPAQQIQHNIHAYNQALGAQARVVAQPQQFQQPTGASDTPHVTSGKPPQATPMQFQQSYAPPKQAQPVYEEISDGEDN